MYEKNAFINMEIKNVIIIIKKKKMQQNLRYFN